MAGEAWDFKPKPGSGVDVRQAAQKVIDSGMAFDELEITPDHVHISFDPQMRHKVIYSGFHGAGMNPDAQLAPRSTPNPFGGASGYSETASEPATDERPF
jgi:hypothetical protein